LAGRHGNNQFKIKEDRENFPTPKGKRTQDVAAKEAGFHNRKTYDQAKAVRAAAKAEPEKHGKALADMNRTGRVNGPFKRVKVARQAAAMA